MSTELKIPSVGESITEVQIGTWLKRPGQAVAVDEPLVEIESDKATVELPSPVAGVLSEVRKQKGEMAQIGEVIGLVTAGATAAEPAAKSEPAPAEGKKPAPQPAAAEPAPSKPKAAGHVMPAAERVLATSGVDRAAVQGTGPGGRVLVEDAQRAAASQAAASQAAVAAAGGQGGARPSGQGAPGARDEEVVPMSMLRRRIAQNLVAAQQTAALLTTFNEVDMSAVMALRQQHKEGFEQRYGARLGFLSFFVKAVVDALKTWPALNAEVRGNDIAYRHYQDIGVAVGGGKGLVVPVLRNAERLSFAEIEATIADFGRRAKDNKLELEELRGGTFTISNGGVYGSLLSTPIVNPPQSGILGLHKIEDRAVVVGGQVVVRPMMYVALTYDHRLVDGREAVGFLVRVKECIEAPTRMLMEV
jgi:2-oxoglutarate dehydrogenase E2 component (dihydrolipoamide succinyltransferase)